MWDITAPHMISSINILVTESKQKKNNSHFQGHLTDAFNLGGHTPGIHITREQSQTNELLLPRNYKTENHKYIYIRIVFG